MSDCQLGARVRQLAQRKGIALPAIAMEARIARSHLYRILAGQNQPTYRTLVGLAHALGVEPGELFFSATRHGYVELEQIVDVCNGLSYDARWRVLHYAKYEATLG